MLKLNTVFGFALAIAATVIGVHAYDTHSAKTETVGVLTKCFGQPPTGEVKCDPWSKFNAEPVVNAKPVVNSSDATPCPPPVKSSAPVTKKTSAKKKSVLVKARHHKSKMSHHHKSKSHGHHHGGHHHGAPPTGPPGCQ